MSFSYCCFYSLLQGNIGPFISGLPTDVPLWLAINLRQRLKCEIILPEWLSIGKSTIVITGS